MRRALSIALMLAFATGSGAVAQTANRSPTDAGGGGVPPPGEVTRSAPSTRDASEIGKSAIGPETAIERKEEKKSEKDVDICKGC